MPEHEQIDYRQLEAGYEFPPASYRLDSSMVHAYLEAVEEDSSLYRDSGLVPPMAIAARALAALSEAVSFPDGAVHVSQVVESVDTADTRDTITSYASVGRIQKRGRFHLLSINLSARKDGDRVVFRGKTDFILPEKNEDGAP
jgi:hypothetical protein